MISSPLQLNNSSVGGLTLKPTEGTTQFSTVVTVSTNSGYRRSEENPRQWQVELSVTFKAGEGKPIPYEGAIAVRGIFTVLAEMPEQATLKMVAVTCPSILYATAREMIGTITGRGVNGPFLLPSVSFADQDLALEKAPEVAKKMVK